MRRATCAYHKCLLCLLGLTLSLPSCGSAEPPAARGEQQQATPSARAEQRSSPEASQGGAAERRKQPWARKNDKRLSTIDAEIELSAEERETILEQWNQERLEILRLIKNQRELETPDWALVETEVAALRKTNDERVRDMLGAERFAVYEKHRPAVRVPKAN